MEHATYPGKAKQGINIDLLMSLLFTKCQYCPNAENVNPIRIYIHHLLFLLLLASYMVKLDRLWVAF